MGYQLLQELGVHTDVDLYQSTGESLEKVRILSGDCERRLRIQPLGSIKGSAMGIPMMKQSILLSTERNDGSPANDAEKYPQK